MPHLMVGYLVIETRRMADWRRFAVDGIGMHADDLPDGRISLRLDDYQRRFLLTEGPAEDVVAVGFEVEERSALDRAAEHLLASGADIGWLSPTETGARAIEAGLGFAGPKGLRFEIAAGLARTNQALEMQTGRFMTGPSGLGHVAITTRRASELRAQVEQRLGARLSDTISQTVLGVPVRFAFYHLNQRHHSIAIGHTGPLHLDPFRKRVQHISIEAGAIEDVTAAFLRCRRLGFKMAMGIGQHPNDGVISFYVITPSGFELELGWNSLLVDDATWKVRQYDRISAWGHFPEDLTAFDRIKSAWTLLTSPLRAS